jgi:hypothetical protein
MLALLREQLPAVTYDSLKRLEQAVIDNLEPVDCPLQHEYIDGVYVRKGLIPAGTVIVGEIHATEHIVIIVTGRILVVSEEGGRKEFVAGDMFVSGPGTKRAGYALEDTICINVHTNKENDRDLDVLKAKLILPELIGYDSKKEIPCGQQ